MSLDGKRLAFARWQAGDKEDYHGEAIPKATVFVRTLATKKDAKVAGASGVPIGWTTAGGLCLSSGVVVDPATGKTVSGTAALPKGLTAQAIAWTRDGKRLAYAPEWSPLFPPPGTKQHLAEVDASGKERVLEPVDKVEPDEGGTLSWSADGRRVAFNLAFLHRGHVPPRRSGFVDTKETEPTSIVLSEISQDNGIPGMHGARRPMKPHPGTTGPALGSWVWNAAGTILAYVSGGGGGNADLYLYDVESKETRRQTSDGATKWSPAVDGPGRRVAYLTGKVEMPTSGSMSLNAENLAISDARLVVLDLGTGGSKEYAVPGEPAHPGNVTWTPDGARVLYEIHGGNAAGTYAQAVPAAAARADVPEPPRSVEVDPEDELVAALRSGDAKRVVVACDQDAEITPKVLAALREVLPGWTSAEDSRAARAILAWIGRSGTTAALPDVVRATKASSADAVSAAVGAIVDLEAKETVPDLEAVRTKGPTDEVRVQAAAAMAHFGDERGWKHLDAAVKHEDEDVRARICSSLARTRDPRSVDVLLRLVADEGFLYLTTGGKNVVGDRAVHALAQLTGVFFRRDLAKWTAWWKDKRKGELPHLPDATQALADYDAWMAEREAAYQEELRKRLPPGFDPGK